MDFKLHLEKAWRLMLENILSLIFMTLVMLVVSFCTLGILGPVTMAGYMESILLLVRDGREPKIQDLFSQMHLFFPLLGFGIIVFILVMIGFLLLILPGIIIALFISFTCLYMIPLMVDKKMGLIDACKKSGSMTLKGELLEQIIVFILYAAALALGSSIFIGILVTQPFATIFLLSAYDEQTDSAALIEIGENQS